MAAKSGEKDNFTRNLVIGMVALVVGVGVIFSVAGNQTKTSSKIPSAARSADGYGIVFNDKATPVIDIWEDFQCPVCRDFEAVNNKQIKEWIDGKKIVAVFHPLSFIGAESAYMANAAACSADEGKFLQFHEALYANQASSENSGQWNSASLIALGANLGISSKSFTDCVSNAKYQDWVTNVANDGQKKNINSTPTVLINGKEIERTQANYFDANTFSKLVFKK